MGISQKLRNFVKVESPTPRNPAGTIESPRFRSHDGQSHSFWEERYSFVALVRQESPVEGV
jgi:hypothetical protein